ncbi:MAG: ligand-binding protein SH3 [Candidatus Hecatellales archaeon B24]|nr:MAG: ligand-binding protein SH3 [Candidatus Hecatellales archaeon B24]
MFSLDVHITVFILSLIPSFEGRYALVFGIFSGLSPSVAMAVATAGILMLSIVLPQAFPRIDDLMVWMLKGGRRFRVRVASAYLNHVGRVRVRVKPYMDKYGIPGLILFVALPIPSSGVWTGALIAYLLGMGRYKSMMVLLTGGLLSNFITLVFTVLGFRLPV